MPLRPAIFCALLAACAPEVAPTIVDGSSPERFAATTAAAREQLSPADRVAFDGALGSVRSRRYSADPQALLRTTFDGMTGTEIAEEYRRRTR